MIGEIEDFASELKIPPLSYPHVFRQSNLGLEEGWAPERIRAHIPELAGIRSCTRAPVARGERKRLRSKVLVRAGKNHWTADVCEYIRSEGITDIRYGSWSLR